MSKLTLEYMREKGYQVIVIYPKMATHKNIYIWPRRLCPNPWANTTNIDILASFLHEGLEERGDNAFFVSQAILTPTTRTVRKHIRSSLEETLAKISEAHPSSELSKQYGKRKSTKDVKTAEARKKHKTIAERRIKKAMQQQ